MSKTFLCNWSQDSQGFSLWLSDAPDVKVRGRNLVECRDVMQGLIEDRYGDIDATVELIGGQPGTLAKYFKPEIRAITWDSGATLKMPVEEVFEGGVCSTCGNGIGRRTGSPLRVVKLPSDADAIQVGRTPLSGYSERLLRTLGLFEMSEFELRPIATLPRFEGPIAFFEVVPTGEVNVKPVAVSGLRDGLTAWRCESCGSMDINYETDGTFVRLTSASSLSRSPHSCFVLWKTLCVPGDRWRSARKALEIERISAEPIGVIPDSEIDDAVRFEVRRPDQGSVPFWAK